MIYAKINTVFIPVKNLKKAVEWYCDSLGFPVDPKQWEIIEELPVYTFQMGETSLTLEGNVPNDFTPSNVPICNIHTTNLAEEREKMQSKGIKIETDIIHLPGLSYFNLRDLDGNVLMLCTG